MISSSSEWKEFVTRVKNEKIDTDKDELKKVLLKAIEEKIPDEKFGVLFSGGVDSTFIALVCKQLGKEFTCYTAGIENSEDIAQARIIAKELGFDLKDKVFSLDEARVIIKKTLNALNEIDVVKVGVGATIMAAIELAKKDGVKYLFSGLGSEEIFAGYQRHEQSKNINEECWDGLMKMYARDIDRDNKIANYCEVEFLVPLLEKDVIVNAMNFKGEDKIKDGQNKVILREIAKDIGLKSEFANRKKRAAQYGSKFDRAILRLARKEGLKYKKEYLESLQ